MKTFLCMKKKDELKIHAENFLDSLLDGGNFLIMEITFSDIAPQAKRS